MLSLNMGRGEYFTINENIVVQVYPQGNQATVCVDAPREIPVVRGTLRELEGKQKPAAIAAAEAKGRKPRTVTAAERLRKERYCERKELWQSRKNSAKDALATMERSLEKIESPELRQIYREQLQKLVPLTE